MFLTDYADASDHQPVHPEPNDQAQDRLCRRAQSERARGCLRHLNNQEFLAVSQRI